MCYNVSNVNYGKDCGKAMRKQKLLSLILSALLMFSLTSCGKSAADTEGIEARPGIVAQTQVLSEEDLAALTGEEIEPDEDADNDITEGETPDLNATADPSASASPKTPAANKTGTSYRYQSFVLERAGTSNAVFSGEALLTSLDMWSELVGEPQNANLEKYIAKDYLSYTDSDSLKLVKRLWTNNGITVKSEKLSPLAFALDMSNPSATGTKNTWVGGNTGGLVQTTPLSYTKDTALDMMTVPFFRDSWKNGAKPYDTKSRQFKNADGSQTDTVMLRDEGLTYWSLGNATAYCMYFENGSYMMVVLPGDGVNLSDVDVSGLMSGTIESSEAHVKFYMPEFNSESQYILSLKDLGLSDTPVNEERVSGIPVGFSPQFAQTAKLKINRGGANDAMLENEIGINEDYQDDMNVVNVICDRPFMYYIGDAANTDILFFGVVNQIDADTAVTPQEAGIA